MRNNLEGPWDKVDIEAATEKEKEKRKSYKRLKKLHVESIEKRDYNAKSGLIYSNLYNLLSSSGDHIMNVSDAIKGQA